MRKLILILIIVGCIAIISAQDSTNINLTDTTIVKNSNAMDNNLYKLLYENAKENNSELISILTTSLTLLFGVIIAIIGSSIYYNYRFNKKEYELLYKEVVNKLEETQSRLLDESSDKISKISSDYQNEIDEKYEQLSETYKTNFETVRDSYKEIINSFKKDSNRQIEQLVKENNLIRDYIENIKKSSKDDLNYKENDLKRELSNIKGDLYLMKNWYALALDSFINQASFGLDINYSWELKYTLDDIQFCINKIMDTEDTITPRIKEKLDRMLSKVPERFSDKKDKIINVIDKIKIKDIDISGDREDFGLLSAFLNDDK